MVDKKPGLSEKNAADFCAFYFEIYMFLCMYKRSGKVAATGNCLYFAGVYDMVLR